MQFLESRLEPFSITGLLEFLGESVNAVTVEDLAGFLVFNQLAYMNPSIGGESELWLTRAGLFTGKPLVLCPTNSEIVSGVFIPGSRFVPFCNPALLPHELIFMHGGKQLPRVALECTPEEIYPKYQLFGDEYTPQYLSLDNEENGALFSEADYEDPAELTVTVIDVRELYWSARFKPGDRLIARLTDWKNGVFELAVLSSEELDPVKQAAWMQEMEDSLLHSFDIAGPGASMDEQLAFAYFLGLDTLFTPFAASLSDFLRWSAKVAIEPYGVESRLWYADETIPAQGSWTMTLVSAPTSMAEEAFMHLALPLSARVMDSYILDALFRKETAIDALIERMIPPRLHDAAFCVPVIKRAVLSRFKHLAVSYNWFADHETGVIRSRCLALHMALMHFVLQLQRLGIEPDLIPDQGAVVLGQLMSHTISALENIDFSATGNSSDLESLWVSVEGMEDSFFETKTAIQDKLPELTKRRFSIIKKKEKTDE